MPCGCCVDEQLDATLHICRQLGGSSAVLSQSVCPVDLEAGMPTYSGQQNPDEAGSHPLHRRATSSPVSQPRSTMLLLSVWTFITKLQPLPHRHQPSHILQTTASSSLTPAMHGASGAHPSRPCLPTHQFRYHLSSSLATAIPPSSALITAVLTMMPTMFGAHHQRPSLSSLSCPYSPPGRLLKGCMNGRVKARVPPTVNRTADMPAACLYTR